MNTTDSSNSNTSHATAGSLEPGEGAASAMDAEDQMVQALDALRQERAETGGDAQVSTATMPAGPDGDLPAAMAMGAEATGTDAAQTRARQAAAQHSDRAGNPDPAELLRRTQEELHKARSEMGRVGQLNRYLNQARAERDRLLQENAQLKGRGGRAAPGTQGDSSAAASARLAELSAKVQQFPELHGLVGAVQQALQAVDAQAATVAEQTAARMVEPLHGLRAEHEQRAQEQRSAAYQAAMQTFEATYPNAVEVVRSADFSAWIGTQPQPIQTAFYQGQDPGEAIAVMDAYDAHLRRAGRAPIARYPQQQQPAAQRASANAARLQSAAGLTSRASGARGGLPPEDDFEASLDFFRRQRLGGLA
ncbi:hypothetical protein PMI14_03064 [Acidovorax sp. CF316]|uniref:hypothetical protein n=1 Tax=Acidovorax sp. CF316 TaxID=1144317 RepID=UPI00026BCF83|nr:hypothetical protein [Acidovorax sp. CF316]EJE52261.1 hypothetical protein PMI14_03064 [Acidovorax sp. CF316]